MNPGTFTKCLLTVVAMGSLFGLSSQSTLQILPAHSQNRISENANRCIFKDSKGFLWVGTIDGLNRYDGYRFHIYHSDPRDINSIAGNYITRVIEDGRNNIWVGTDRGINRYHWTIDGFERFAGPEKDPQGLGSAYITDITLDENRQIWMAAYDGFGYFDYGQQQFVRIPFDPKGRPDAVLNIEVTALSPATGHGFWIGYQDGQFSRYYNGQFYHYRGLLTGNTIHDLFEDREGNLWLGTSGGVFRFDLKKNELSKYHELGTWDIYPMGDKLWMNVNFDGIYEWNPRQDRLDRVPVYLHGQQVFGDVKAFFKDEEGIIWASYHGLFKQDPYEKRFSVIRKEPGILNSISEQFVGGIAEDEKGNWVVLTVNKGLNYYDRTSRRWLNHQTHPWFDNELLNVRLSRLKVIGHHAYVVNQNAVYDFNLETGVLKEFEVPEEELGLTVPVFDLSPGKLWLSGKQILLLDTRTGKFSDFTPDHTPQTDLNFILARDKQKNIWAVAGNKIYKLEPSGAEFVEKFQFADSEINFEGSISSLKIDDKGSFWIGRRNGLEHYDPANDQLRNYTIVDGLPNNVVNSILIDHHGKLWLGTNNGLSKFDPETEKFRNYDRLDGIQDEIFLPGSAFKNRDGVLYFGGVNGFNFFHPDSLLPENPHPPKVLITDLKIFNRSVVPGKKSILSEHISNTEAIELSYKDASISFELLALGYSQPLKNKYKYMIEGVDPEWYDIVSGQTATYTGLPRGQELIFRAKAANHDGTWNEEPTVLRIYIRPPFWETPLFRVVLLVALLGIFLLYYHWRVRSIKLRNLWLEREVKKKTTEIETQANHLKLVNEDLKQQARIIQEQVRQLDQLNKAQSRFFTSLSHEFRTPLTLLLGNLDELIHSPKPEQVIDKIGQRMKMSARQLLVLINQLMDTAKLESGQYQLRVRKGALKDEIRNILSPFQSLAKRKGLHLKLTFRKGMPDQCWYDPDILQKVLNNLLSNAIKYTEKGTIHIIGCPKKEKEGKPLLCLKVTDTGVGIPEKQLPFIFDRFFQVEGHFSARNKGTGIGLSLVKLLVELHKGTLGVESFPGKGTTFELTFPVSKAAFLPAERPGRMPKGNPALGNIREFKVPLEPLHKNGRPKAGKNAPILLVVEDNPEIRSFIVRQLEAQYKILQAEHGKQALAMAIKQIPDLIISDVVMPEMNGFEFSQKIKSDQRTSHIPLILLTALAGQDPKLQGLKHGADAFLSKPFSREELLVRISNLISYKEKIKRRFLVEYNVNHFPDGLNELDQAFLGKMNTLIEKHLADEEFGIDNLVRAFGVSRTQLFRKLKSLTGMSASEFIRDFRLRKAYQLLHEGDLTVSEVIYATGFNSRSYFYDSFKKKFGIAPSQLKKV